MTETNPVRERMRRLERDLDARRRQSVTVTLPGGLVEDAKIVANLAGDSLDEFVELCMRRLVGELAGAGLETLNEWRERLEPYTEG